MTLAKESLADFGNTGYDSTLRMKGDGRVGVQEQRLDKY